MDKNIEQIISTFSITQDKYDLLIKKLSRYNIGNYIYESAFIRAGFSDNFINQFFNELENNHFIEKNYTIYSPFSLERQMFVTNKKEEIPETYECETTDEEFDTTDQIRIIYKVKNDFLV